MAIEGELCGVNGTTCTCGRDLPLKVCQSGAGFYLGYYCPNCGPYSRESDYVLRLVKLLCPRCKHIAPFRDVDIAPGKQYLSQYACTNCGLHIGRTQHDIEKETLLEQILQMLSEAEGRAESK